MKWILSIAALFSSMVCMAQVPEDVTDTRSKRESFAKLPQKDILRSEIASFAIAGIQESVGKLPLDKIAFTAQSNGTMQFAGGGISALITTGPFEAGKHKLTYEDEKWLIRIDKKPYYGSNPNLPKTQINQLEFIIGKDTVQIPVTAYNDLYNLNLTYKDKKGNDRSLNAVYFSKDKRTIYFYIASKDDKAGSYEVTWIIQDKKYLRRVLDYDISM